jgi:predicted DNA-binding protein YlxM (UPF0122 family)
MHLPGYNHPYAGKSKGLWTLEDRKLLEKSFKEGRPISQISEILQRPRGSIATELNKSGFKVPSYDALKAHEIRQKILSDRKEKYYSYIRNDLPLSEEQMAIFKMGYLNGYSVAKIAALSGVSRRRYLNWIKKNGHRLPEINARTLEDRIQALEMVVDVLSKAIKKINQKTGDKNE